MTMMMVASNGAERSIDDDDGYGDASVGGFTDEASGWMDVSFNFSLHHYNFMWYDGSVVMSPAVIIDSATLVLGALSSKTWLDVVVVVAVLN